MNHHSRHASERIKKKKKIVDLKAFVGCKLLSKSEKNLQKIDYINDIMMLEPVIIKLIFYKLNIKTSKLFCSVIICLQNMRNYQIQ